MKQISCNAKVPLGESRHDVPVHEVCDVRGDLPGLVPEGLVVQLVHVSQGVAKRVQQVALCGAGEGPLNEDLCAVHALKQNLTFKMSYIYIQFTFFKFLQMHKIVLQINLKSKSNNRK